MCDVTFRRVRAVFVAVEKQWVLHIVRVCICSLGCPACNAHAPCCHLWPAPLYKFSTFSRKWRDFRKKKKLLNTKRIFFILPTSTTFVWNISHSKNKWERYDKICIMAFKCPLFLSILMKLEFSRQIFENPQVPNFMKIRLLVAELFHAEG